MGPPSYSLSVNRSLYDKAWKRRREVHFPVPLSSSLVPIREGHPIRIDPKSLAHISFRPPSLPPAVIQEMFLLRPP